MRSTKADQQTVVEEICYKSQEIKPWLVIFHLPSEPVWYVTLFIANYVAILESLFSSANNICLGGRFKQFMLVADIVYVIDLILAAFVRFVKKLNITTPEVVKRPLWMVLCDIYSLIPQELLYSGDESHYCLMRTNRALRAFRLSCMVYKSYKSLNRSIFMYIVDFSLAFTLCGFVSFSIYCNGVCRIGKCVGTACDAPDFFKGITCSMLNIIERTIEDELFYKCVRSFFVLFVLILGFFFRSFISVHQIHRATHQHVYIYRYKVMKHIHHTFNIPEYIKNGAEKGYNLYWQHSRGYRESKHCLAIMSPVLFSEILIDISWPAFKHSKLFRGMDLPFLREVARHMQQIYLLPGEIIYRNSQLKEKMIYVVSGTISVLSDEDGESPIISFTSGTIIGEVCLFTSTKSTNFLQCKTFCHLHILEQKDFLRICSKFPCEYLILRSMIYERFQYAKECNKIVLEARENIPGIHRDVDVYTICWLKNILHTLMSSNTEAAYRHDFQNIYLMREKKQDNLKYLLFSANNLDMLAITERIEKNQDANFAKLKFPYIIHSTSVIIKLWEVFVVAWTLLFSFIIPYMVFISTYLPVWYKPLILCGTFTFMIDIYIQISTTIETSAEVLSSISTITKKRFQSVDFWVDLLSCFPFEVFNPIVSADLSVSNVAKMHLNRILKVWRIECLFQTWMYSITANHIFIVFLRYTWILSYVTFGLFMYLRYENPNVDLLRVIFISSQWARTLDYSTEGFEKDDTIKQIVYEYVFLIIFAFYGSVAFIHVIKHFNFLKVQQISFDLLAVVKTANLKSYSDRVIGFILLQWHANFCYYLHKHYLKHIYFSKTMLAETIDAMYGDDVRNIPLFQCFCDSFCYDACNLMKVVLFSPKEVICYYGYVTGYAYILLRGSCQLLNGRGSCIKTVSGLYCCNLLEVLLQTPNAHTFRAATHCLALRFDRKKLLRQLFRYQIDFRFLQSFLMSCPDIKRSLCDISKPTTVALATRHSKTRSFVFYPLYMEKDSLQEYDFYIPYDRLYPFSFIRYFFLRCSIIPDGTFLYVWQFIRSCLVLVTGICYFVPIIIVDYAWILHTLDVLTLLHMYIRLHVCFYNSDGILVTHPLETAAYYWRNGLLIDFFSVVPFRYILSSKYDWTIVLINCNHLLQLHSYIHLMHYVKTDIINARPKWCSLFYLPFILVLCNVLGMILFTTECTISHDSSTAHGIYVGYHCIPDSVLASSPFSKPISLTRAHLYYVYISTVLVTNVSLQGPVIKSKVAMCIFMIALLICLYISVSLVSQMQELHCFRQRNLLENQIATKHLKKFLKATVRDSKLKKVVIRTCELKWLRFRGQGVFEVVKQLTVALRGDILYHLYGKTLHYNSPIKGDAALFYKNVLPLMKFHLIIKGGYLQTINDIDDNIYILYQGMADVLAPDGTTFQTLQAGSLYGNILDKERSRLRLSIVAMTHVEVLACKTKVFLSFLRYYPLTYRDFEKLRRKYIYYIPTSPGIIRVSESSAMQQSKNLFAKALEPNSNFVKIWTFLYLTFACYFGVLIDIYQVGSADYSYSLITIQYLCDLLYLANFLFQDRLAYEDDWGYMVYDLPKIKQRNRKNKFMLRITVIGMLPIDVVIYSFNVALFNKGGFNSLYRINRSLRIIHLANYIQVKLRKLDVSIFLMKFLSFCMWSFLIVNTFASLLAAVSCSLTPNLSPKIPNWDTKLGWNTSEQAKLHLTFLQTAWAVFSLAPQRLYVPQGDVHIALFIFTMICGYYCFMISSCEVFSMINEFYMKKGQYLKIYNHIKYFLVTQNVSASLRMKCLNICSNLWTNNEGEMFPRILHELPPYLKDAVMNCAFGLLIGDDSAFEKCHADFVRQVVQKIKYRIYYPGTYVQFKGAIDRTMYFVFDGEVHALVDEYMNNDKVVSVLYRGNSFGIKEGLNMTKPHMYSYMCKTTSIILSLYLHDWEYLLAYFPASKQILYKESVNASAKMNTTT